jgi:uncharacterized membrane protein
MPLVDSAYGTTLPQSELEIQSLFDSVQSSLQHYINKLNVDLFGGFKVLKIVENTEQSERSVTVSTSGFSSLQLRIDFSSNELSIIYSVIKGFPSLDNNPKILGEFAIKASSKVSAIFLNEKLVTADEVAEIVLMHFMRFNDTGAPVGRGRI